MNDRVEGKGIIYLFVLIVILLFIWLASGCSSKQVEPEERMDYSGVYKAFVHPSDYVYKEAVFHIAHYENNKIELIGSYTWQRYGMYDQWQIHKGSGHIQNKRIWFEFETEELMTSWGVMRINGSFSGSITNDIMEGVLQFDEFNLVDTLKFNKTLEKINPQLLHNQGGVQGDY